ADLDVSRPLNHMLRPMSHVGMITRAPIDVVWIRTHHMPVNYSQCAGGVGYT
ncbi:hypothetical protein BD779DRAFT_1498933, partial [Infundibulicybe gibba]